MSGATFPGCVIDPTAHVFSGVRMVRTVVGQSCCIANDCDLVDVTMEPKSEFGRRSLVRDTTIGFGSYTGSNVVVKGTDIGKLCSISWNLSIGGADHDYEAASMYTPYWWDRTFGVSVSSEQKAVRTRLGSDVWVGCGANVLAGVTIGDGAVIASGAIVTHDVPHYAVVAGVPAKVIKYRFSEEWIERLLRIKWWEWPVDVIATSSKLLHGKLDEDKLCNLELISDRLQNASGV